ncbi:MAG: hypothetical protein AAF280_01005 [Pseudomonadota bacterium]
MKKLGSSKLQLALAAWMACQGLTAQAQDGGVYSELSFSQRIEAANNPALDPGANDARYEATTALDYTITSRTRGKAISFSLGGDFRLSGDEAANTGDGLDFDRPRVELDYTSTSPRLDFKLNIKAVQNDIAFLNPIDLVDFNGGTTALPDDFDDLDGAGTRTSLRYRLRADFDKDRPFSWGIGLMGNAISYSDVTAPNLVDSARVTAVLDTGMSLSPTTRLDTRLGYTLTDEEDGTPASATTFFNARLQSRLNDRVALSAGLALALPDIAADRTTLTGGFTYRPTPTARLGFEAGLAILDGLTDRVVWRVSYEQDLSRTVSFNALYARDVSNNNDNQTVLSSIAQLGVDVALSPISGFSFDGAFVDSDRINVANDSEEMSTSAVYRRQVTKDWTASVGLRVTQRTTSAQGRARSEAIFVTLDRTWTAKHR